MNYKLDSFACKKFQNDFINFVKKQFVYDPMPCVIILGLPNTFFFLENALKKTTEYCLRFLFLFESTILPVNNGK